MNQNKKAKVILGAILVTMLILTGGQSAHATPMLMLSDGTTTVSVTDNGAGDLNTVLGVVTYSGSVGVFTINVATGLTDPALGSTQFPEIHLSDVSMNSTGSGTLTVMFSEVGFTPSAGSVFQTNVGGTTTSTGSLLFSSYADSANTLFAMGTGTQIGSFLHTGNGSFSGNDSTALTPPGLYALTTKAVINHDSAGRISSFDMHVNVVPEPGSLFLLGSGILGLAVLRRKS